MNEYEQFLGIVREGQLHLLAPPETAGNAARLTTIAMQVAMEPETAEIDLAPHEGQALLVRGRGSGGWIWAAVIVDQGGPIIALLVEQVFAAGPASGSMLIGRK